MRLPQNEIMRSLRGFLTFVFLSAMACTALAQMQVVMLGTGTPIPDPARSGPSLAVVVNGTAYLVDAGPGVVRRARAAAEKDNIPALQPVRLHYLFLTHLHSDHTAGLPDLMLTPSVVGRAGGMEIYGPVGTAEMVHDLRAAYAKDIDIRVNGGEHEDASRYTFNVHLVKPGVVFRNADVKVTAIPVLHGTWDESFGYMFDDGKRRVVISGDTRPAESLVKACDGCDVLVHEVYSEAGLMKTPPEGRAYHRSFHTSTVELAKLATEARAKKLVLTHVLFMGQPESSIVDEMRKAGYKGDVVLANDLDVE
jgi:ribonuclease BN (tRNA processing enzyme)